MYSPTSRQREKEIGRDREIESSIKTMGGARLNVPVANKPSISSYFFVPFSPFHFRCQLFIVVASRLVGDSIFFLFARLFPLLLL